MLLTTADKLDQRGLDIAFKEHDDQSKSSLKRKRPASVSELSTGIGTEDRGHAAKTADDE